MKVQSASGPLINGYVDPVLVAQRTLYTGARMPGIGLGTFGSDHVTAGQVAAAVEDAAAVGIGTSIVHLSTLTNTRLDMHSST
jgi:hypothetical protein